MSFIESLLSALVVGSLFFWVFLVVVIGACVIALENESGRWATVAAAVGIFVLTQANKVSIPALITEHTAVLVVAAIVWFAVGTGWGVFRWWVWLHDQLELVQEYRGKAKAPLVSEHKALILMWMTYWPLSAAWFVIHDPVRRLFKLLFNRVANYLQAMSDRVFASVVPKEQAADKS